MPIRPNSNMDVRHPPYMHPDFRIYHMNKRMQERPENNDIQWWDGFVSEFFEDKATFTLSFFEESLKRYTIGRTLIPRFFKTMFESGVADMNLSLANFKDFSNNACLVLESEHATMTMLYPKPVHTKVYVEGYFFAEFSPDEFMRIRSWHFAIRSHSEFIPKQALQHSEMLEQLCKNITRVGLTSALLNFLRMCVVLEPMKELMSRQKTYSLEPRECLKNCLFTKWAQVLNTPDATPRPTKRKRKSSSTNNANNPAQRSKKKNFSSSDVLLVGEPTLMGTEFGDEDERTIQRLENNQFDNQMHVKSEDRDAAANFPSISSPNTTQWQQPVPSTIQTNAAVTPKSEPSETPAEQASPLVSTSS